MTSHTPTNPPLVSSTTQTKKTCRPPYQQFHVVVPPFAHHSEEHKQPSPSQMTPLPIKPSWPPSLECVTTSTVATRTSGKLKRSSELLEPSDTEGHPVKMTKWQRSSRSSTRSKDWNLSLLPLRHYLPLTSPFQHQPSHATCKSW